MKISIYSVGKIKESYYRDAIKEYSKRLLRYSKLNIIEVVDEKTPTICTSNEREIILKKEAERIIPRLDSDLFLIATDIRGAKYTSEKFSELIQDNMNRGKSHIGFIIGGSLGIHKDVLDMCDSRISFSDFTYPHQLMRVILLEQIYRAIKIINNEPYHK